MASSCPPIRNAAAPASIRPGVHRPAADAAATAATAVAIPATVIAPCTCGPNSSHMVGTENRTRSDATSAATGRPMLNSTSATVTAPAHRGAFKIRGHGPTASASAALVRPAPHTATTASTTVHPTSGSAVATAAAARAGWSGEVLPPIR